MEYAKLLPMSANANTNQHPEAKADPAGAHPVCERNREAMEQGLPSIDLACDCPACLRGMGAWESATGSLDFVSRVIAAGSKHSCADLEAAWKKMQERSRAYLNANWGI